MSDHAMPALPATLRGLRVGLDDAATIRRVIHLAAAKIEDLQSQVSLLSAELAKTPGRPNRAKSLQ